MDGGCVASCVLPRFLSMPSARKKGREIFYCGSGKTQRKFAEVLHPRSTAEGRRSGAHSKAPVQLRLARQNQIAWTYETHCQVRECAHSDGVRVQDVFIRAEPARPGSSAARTKHSTAAGAKSKASRKAVPSECGNASSCRLRQFWPRRLGSHATAISGFRRWQAAAD